MRPRPIVEVARSAEPALLLGLAAFLMLLLSKSDVVQFDEGYTLNAAWQTWNGMKMYDDFRLLVGPAGGYAIYFVWKLVGHPSFLAARVLSLLFSFSSIAAVTLILVSRGIRGARLALAVVAWVVASAQYVALNHNSFSSHAGAWMLFAFLRAQERDRVGGGKRVDHVLVGVAGGVVLLFLETKGLALIASAALFTLLAVRGKRGLKAAAALLAGAAAVVAPLLLVWRPTVLVREWFIEPLAGDYLGHTNVSRTLAAVCLAVALGMGAVGARMRDRSLIAVAAFQVALVVSFLNNMDILHVAVNSFPLLVFVPMALQRRAARAPEAATGGEKLSASAVMAIVVGMFAVLMLTPPARPMLERSTLYVDFIRRQSRNIFPRPRVAAAHAIYAGPFMPGLYYELGKKNPYFISFTLVCNAECRGRLLAQIEETRPEIAFLAYEMVRHFGYDQNNPVDAYFRDHYVFCHDYGGLIVRAVDAGWCP